MQQLADFDNNPDMADDTFLLISRAIRYSPGVVLNAQMLPLILRASMAGLLVQHRWGLGMQGYLLSLVMLGAPSQEAVVMCITDATRVCFQ